MNGPEHYRQAQKWLAVAATQAERGLPGDSAVRNATLQAQVHATLALAAATAAQLTDRYVGDDAHINDWHKAVSS